MTTSYRVPIKPDGSVLHYPQKVRIDDPTATYGASYVDNSWRDNEPFTKRLSVVGTISGRSAKYFEWSDAAGATFPMFASDMVELLRSAEIEPGGVVRAVWIVRKRGSNYGIRWHSAAEPANVERVKAIMGVK